MEILLSLEENEEISSDLSGRNLIEDETVEYKILSTWEETVKSAIETTYYQRSDRESITTLFISAMGHCLNHKRFEHECVMYNLNFRV